MLTIVIYLLMAKKYWSLKPTKNVNVQTQFSLGDILSAEESREVSLNGNMYDFSVYYNSIDNSDILNIHKSLMSKNNIK